MTPDFVADVGNTRIKWAACRGGHVVGPVVSVPDDQGEWERAAPPAGAWAIASVRPERSQRFKAWLESRGHRVVQVTAVPPALLRVDLEHPDKAGIDRLLNAVAAKRWGESAVLVDAGSAVTVDRFDAPDLFRGGAIFPGLDLMAEALHRYTALLPRVEVTWPLPRLPGRATVPAIQRGIHHAVVGGIKDLVAAYGLGRVILTGGQAPLLAPSLPGVEVCPELTLMGILACAEGLP